MTAPGVEGYLGVMANHAPLMTQLDIGHLDFRRDDGGNDELAIGGGFMEVFDNKVTVLADSAEIAAEIDVERAKSSVTRAEERLAAGVTDIDLDRAKASLMRAMNRLNVAHRH